MKVSNDQEPVRYNQSHVTIVKTDIVGKQIDNQIVMQRKKKDKPNAQLATHLPDLNFVYEYAGKRRYQHITLNNDKCVFGVCFRFISELYPWREMS